MRKNKQIFFMRFLFIPFIILQLIVSFILFEDFILFSNNRIFFNNEYTNIREIAEDDVELEIWDRRYLHIIEDKNYHIGIYKYQLLRIIIPYCLYYIISTSILCFLFIVSRKYKKKWDEYRNIVKKV